MSLTKCKESGNGQHCDCEQAKERGNCCFCYEDLRPKSKNMDGYLSVPYSSDKSQWLSWDVETTSKRSYDIVGSSSWADYMAMKPKKEAAPPVEDFCDDDGSDENVDYSHSHDCHRYANADGVCQSCGQIDPTYPGAGGIK